MTGEMQSRGLESQTVTVDLEPVPSDAALEYTDKSIEYLLQDDEVAKRERSEKKEEVTSLALDVLREHGMQIPKEVASALDNSKKVQTYYRETPIVAFPRRNGDVVGYRLRDDVRAFISGPHEEGVQVTHLHLTIHDPETGEQIGRKSAAFLGGDDNFAYNAKSARAENDDFEGMLGVIQYIDSMLSVESTQESQLQPQID